MTGLQRGRGRAYLASIRVKNGSSCGFLLHPGDTMRALLCLSLLVTVPASASAQTAPSAGASAAEAFAAGLEAVCKPWLAGEERAAMAKRLTAEGWRNAIKNVVFTAEGPWGVARFTAQEPAGGRGCMAMVTITESPWSTAGAIKVGGRWAEINIGGTEKEGTVELDGKTADAWAWSKADGSIARLLAYRAAQSSGGDVILFIDPPAVK
jgi:hypothetical protein